MSVNRFTCRRLSLVSLSWFAIAAAAPQAVGAELFGAYRSAPGQVAPYVYHAGVYYTEHLPLDVTFEFPGGDPTTMLTATFHKPIIGALADGTPIQDIGAVIPLVVTGTSSNGTDFEGDLLGTQYLFDWEIVPAAGGELLWSGVVGWAGGRVETTTITGARLVPMVIPEPAALAMLSVAMLALMARRRPLACTRR